MVSLLLVVKVVIDNTDIVALFEAGNRGLYNGVSQGISNVKFTNILAFESSDISLIVWWIVL